MISKELLQRIESFFQKLPANDTLVEKYFRKLKSEKEIQGYKVLGIGKTVNVISADICFKDDWYRLAISFHENKIIGLTIINQSDLEDFYSNQWLVSASINSNVV